jgi:hypothetical protein
MRLVSLGGLLGVLSACGGGSSSGGAIMGTVYGHQLATMDVVSAAVMVNDSGTGAVDHLAMIVMGNAAGLCAKLTRNARPANFEGISIELTVISGPPVTASTPTTAGTFTVASAPANASVNTLTTDATCHTVAAEPSENATSGTVTLTSVSGDVFSGDFSVSFANGDAITGSFDPAGCPAVQNFASPPTTPTCE